MSDEEDWSPPSEAELKVIQAKRERSDKISKLMGDYLLKVIFRGDSLSSSHFLTHNLVKPFIISDFPFILQIIACYPFLLSSLIRFFLGQILLNHSF